MESISNKVVLVTGGVKRIGRTISLAFAREGAHVIITYKTSKKEAHRVKEEVKRKGVNCWIMKTNLANSEKSCEVIDKALDKVGRIDILVNNAAVYPFSDFHTLSMNEVKLSMNINTWAPLFLIKGFATRVKKGCIVNVIDAQVKGFAKGRFAYLISKNALSFITRILAIELAPNIRVNAVAPGPILPPSNKGEKHLKKISQKLPLRKSGTPEDIAQAVIFLARSDFITGEIIYVDGGYHLRGTD